MLSRLSDDDGVGVVVEPYPEAAISHQARRLVPREGLTSTVPPPSVFGLGRRTNSVSRRGSSNSWPGCIRGRQSMDLPDAVEQLTSATRSLKLCASWLESQSDEQIREIGSGNWLPLNSAVHDLKEGAIELDRECHGAKAVR